MGERPRLSGAQVWGKTRDLGSDARGPARLEMRRILEAVVERGKRLRAAERACDQPVGEPGVLGQERAVQVGADDPAAADALAPVPSVVAVTAEDPAERARVGPEE